MNLDDQGVRDQLLAAGWRPPTPEPDETRQPADPDLVRLSLLGGRVHAATEHLPLTRSAVALFDLASRQAEASQALPGPLGTAIASVLALAADRRRSSCVPGCWGESASLLALALAVQELP